MSASQPPPINTRKPTGLPVWPTALLAGVEGSGKSVRAALASASKMVHRTFWVGAGEDDPDEYGIYDGVRFEIVEHDGSYRGILTACEAAAGQLPGKKGEPNLIVLDSGSRFWNLLHDDIQATADARAIRKAKREGRRAELPEDGAKITPDLWNTARDRWYNVLDTLRYRHAGPVIITSRLKMTTVFENGEPTKNKEWDQKAQFDLPYDVGLYVQMRAPYPARDDWMVRVKSARYKHPVDDQGNAKATALDDDWSFEDLWTQFGLGQKQPVGEAQGHQIQHSGDLDSEETRRAELLEEIKNLADARGVSLPAIVEDWGRAHNGEHITRTTDFGGLELLRDDLAAPPVEPDPEPEKPKPAKKAAAKKAAAPAPVNPEEQAEADRLAAEELAAERSAE